jgi:hydrogenase nickel incorporation protein HypA/HybF
MHELSIALGIVEAATEEADRLGASRVTAVHLRLGAMSGVVATALRSAFELAREQTALADAELRIEELPIVAHCPACAGERTVLSIQDLRCGTCGTPTPDIVRGRELEVVALEIES